MRKREILKAIIFTLTHGLNNAYERYAVNRRGYLKKV